MNHRSIAFLMGLIVFATVGGVQAQDCTSFRTCIENGQHWDICTTWCPAAARWRVLSSCSP